MIDDSEVPGAYPPKDHPLSRLAVRLGELLDEDQWAECESLVLKAWKSGEKERKALAGLPDGALDGGWTAAGMSAYAKRLEDQLEDMRTTLNGIVDADWRTWQELASPDEFVRWAKSRANHALVRNNAKVSGGGAFPPSA